MEELQECARSSRKLSDDVSAIYERIIEYRDQTNIEEKQSNKSWFKSFAGRAMIAVLIFIAVLYFLLSIAQGNSNEGVRLILQSMVLLVYAMGVGVVLLQYFSIKELFKDFSGQIIGITADVAKHEAELFEELDAFSTNSIKYVANRFEQTSTQLGLFRSFLLGAIDKVGIIPGLLATVLAISKVAQSTGFSWLELLSFVMLVIYMSMFPIAEAAFKIKRISFLLNQYLVLVRASDELIKVDNQLQQTEQR